MLGAGDGLIARPELAINVATAIVETRTGIARSRWRETGKVEDNGDVSRVEFGPGERASPLPDIYVVEIRRADCQILTYEPIEGLFSRSKRLELLPARETRRGG